MNLILLIVLGIVLLSVGFIIALLVIPLFVLENKSAEKTDIKAPKQTDLEPARSNQLIHPQSLQVWRDPQKDSLLVELDGQIYDSATQLSQAQRNFLSVTAAELNSWMGQTDTPPDSAPQEKTLQPNPPMYKTPVEAKAVLSDQNAVNPFAKLVKAESPKWRSQVSSLAAQIDEILQEKLALSHLSQHIVHLTELPNYGMTVQVDREQYDSVDSVADEEIRNLIREAVNEWQRRNSPGRM